MNAYTVYKHTSPGGKTYIGITARAPARRWHGGSAYRNNPHFYAAIKKYGWENFTHEIIASGLSKEAACDMEIQLIKECDSRNPKHGYNRSQGGDKTMLGYHMSEETRRKISDAAKARPPVVRTEAWRRHLRDALLGHPTTAETREKLRLALGNRFQTEEARKKQKENTPRGERHHKAKAVQCVETGVTYPTLTDAAKVAGCNYVNIARCCNGKQKTAAGHHWVFIKEKEENRHDIPRLDEREPAGAGYLRLPAPLLL